MVSNRRRTSAVFNGIFQGPALNAKSLMLPKLTVLLLQIASFNTDTPKSSVQSANAEGTVPIASVEFEDGEEGFLRDLHVTDLFHALFAFLLLFQKFALT